MDFNLYNLNNLKNFNRFKNVTPLKSFNYFKRVRAIAKQSLDWLIPRMCINCNETLAQDNHPCCQACYMTLPFQSHCCEQCGQSYSGGADYCGRCIAKPPPFDACFCPFQYEAPVSQQIRAFKYNEKPELAKTLAQLLFTEIQTNELEPPDLLIPVPMHTSKLRQRGYNQSLLLTQQLSKLMRVPYNSHLLRKYRATPAQAELSLKQRRTNLRGCFEFIGKTSAKHVAIVDDVFTTGATASEIAKILKKNGVDYIQFLGVAHTI